MILTEKEQRDYFRDAIRAVKKKGADPVFVAEKIGYRARSVPLDDVVKALMKACPVQASAVDALPEGRKGAEKHRVDEIRKAHRRGSREADAATLPGEDELERKGKVNAEVEKLAIRDEALERRQAEKAGTLDEGDDYADVAEIIANGVERRVPDAGGLRSDGARLAYSGAVNGLVGPPESGKTLVAIAQACDELKAGGRVLHVDADHNGPQATLAHYLAADGVEAEILTDRARFRYVEVRSADHLRRVVAEAASWSPTFVPIDSVGEIVPLFGGDSNSNDDYRSIHREIMSPLAGLGAAVLVLDHVTKEEGRGGYAIGAGSKKAAIDGTYLAVAPVEPFVPGVGGAAALSILKDRHGGLRAVSPAGKSPTAAVFRLDSRSDVTTWEFFRGRDPEERADEQHEADVAFVLALEEFPSSRAKLQAVLRAGQGTGWNNSRAHAALEEARRRRDSATTFPITEKE